MRDFLLIFLTVAQAIAFLCWVFSRPEPSDEFDIFR